MRLNRAVAVFAAAGLLLAATHGVSGGGEIRPVVGTRLLEAGEIPPEVNRYFFECYRRFMDLKCVLEAREHTAQVASDDREEREDRFRRGDLPLLFCSPTMELGVDIAQLNVVNLRNVPPTPANYAQRSGRARRAPPPLPADRVVDPRPARGVRGAAALASPHPWSAEPRRLPVGGGGVRAHAADRRLGA